MIYQGKVINPGRLRTPVKLKSVAITTDSGGRQAPSTTLMANAWAECRPAYGSEAWTAGITLAERPMTILMRYNANLNETCLVEVDGLDYEIVGLIDLDMRHEFHEIKARLVTAGK